MRILQLTLIAAVASELLCAGFYELVGHVGPWWTYVLPVAAPLLLMPPIVYVLLSAKREASALHAELAERNRELEAEVNRRMQLEQDLRRAANEDPLTGALNRRGFEEAAQIEIAIARRHQRPLSVVLMDLDDFKRLNDHFGHAMGDEALRAFAETVEARLRQGDRFGRLGGDEFAAVLREVDETGARSLARQLRTVVGSIRLVAGARSVPVAVSVGVAALTARDESIEDLLARADDELYASKESKK